jgi:hypothetical protein
MQCLTVQQPFAHLIVSGYKRLETRAWSTPYRGPLLIHAGHNFPEANKKLCYTEPVRSWLLRLGLRSPKDFAFGAIVGVATMVGCKAVEQLTHIPHDELVVGYFGLGYNAFTLEGPRRFETPTPCRGQPKLWEFDVAQLVSQDLALVG